MYISYGIHKREWNKYKSLVIKNGYDNLELKRVFELNEKQLWFLFTKLLQDKYNHLYLRAIMKKEDLRHGQYVYCDELGNGIITKLYEDSDLMLVKFESKDLNVMCNKNGYTVYDEKRRKITKR